MRQRMAGESLRAQHQEEADEPATPPRRSPAAANAFCMKSYVNMVRAMIMLMRVAFDVMAARHHEDAAVHAHHVDHPNHTGATAPAR